MYRSNGSGKVVIRIYCFGSYIYRNLGNRLIKNLLLGVYKTIDLSFVRFLQNAEFPCQCVIGKNLCLPHGGNGIIIHPNTRIGDDVTIYHQVTIGAQRLGQNPRILIGNNVVIGTGAKILGNVKIGDGATIGANAVVLSDIPQGRIAVGVPARII